jgi:hypothetical protein
MNMGRKIFNALILYCKIDPYEIVTGKKQILEVKEKPEEEKKDDFNLDSIVSEFKENKDELMFESDAGSSAGSDSEPSADNMSDDEIAKILPVKPKKKKEKKKLVSQNSLKKRRRELELKLKEKNKRREEEEKAKRSPTKRITNYKNALKDRFNLSRIKKVEMVDAWTQTSNKGSDTEQDEKKEEKEEDQPKLNPKSTDHSFYSQNLDDSPISLYKRNNPSQKYKINMNSALSNHKTFRSPISSSITSDYRKKDYNTSFTLSKSKARLYRQNEFETTDSIQHHRHNSSHLDGLGERYSFAQRQVRKSPKKSYYPPGSGNSGMLTGTNQERRFSTQHNKVRVTKLFLDRNSEKIRISICLTCSLPSRI